VRDFNDLAVEIHRSLKKRTEDQSRHDAPKRHAPKVTADNLPPAELARNAVHLTCYFHLQRCLAVLI
jgi:hypothetical protein